jgi:hypothetical protein
MDTLSDLRVESICAEFDARLEQVGIAMARLELAKALAENEKTIVELAELKMDYAIKGGEMLAEITQLRVELERHVEWLENVDHDYSNGNSACGCDEGAVLGQRGESQLLASSHAILAKYLGEQK